MKRALPCLLSIMMLLACVPTPEVDAVKQKDTNVLIDTVRSEQEKQDDSAAALPSVKEQMPERFQCDFTAVQGMRVLADVPLEILTDGAFPMLEVEKRLLTRSDRVTLSQRVLGSEDLYIFEENVTRKDVAEWIRMLMQEPSPEEKAEWMREENGTEEQWQQMQKRRRELIAEYQQMYNELPDDDARAPLRRWDGSAPELDRYDYSAYDLVTDPMPEGYRYMQERVQIAPEELNGFTYMTARANEYDVTGVFSFDHSRKTIEDRIDPNDYDKPHDGATATPNDAIRLVQGLFDGVCRFKPAEVWWANNVATDGEATSIDENTRWAYLLRLTQDYDGACGPYCSADAADWESDAEYIVPWAYESLVAAVDGSGKLISLQWCSPLKVTKTVAESTPLLPYEEILGIFETQINREFIYESFKDATLTVEKVQLGLFRIREKNDMEHGLMVPVWFFTGYLQYAKDQKKQSDEGIRFDSLNPLLIINAIDGSIINAMNGY